MVVVGHAVFVRVTVERHLQRPLHVLVVVMIERGVQDAHPTLNERQDKREHERRDRP